MWLPVNQNSGVSTKFEKMPPAQNTIALRMPITYPRPSTKLIASKLNTIRALIGERPHHRHKLEIEILLPGVERGNKKVINAGDGGRLQQQPRLRSAFFSSYQDLGDGGCFGEGEMPMRLAHKISPQRNQEQHAKAPAGQADENGLHRMRIEMQRVERGHRKHRARNHGCRGRANAGDNYVLEQR